MILIYTVILGIIWSEIISHFGASILLHRYYCHNQFKVPKWFETIGLAMLMIACIRTPIGWIASHRMHHHHSDTDKDPHAAEHIGYWKVLFTTWDIERIPTKYARDLFVNPKLVFCHKHWLKILIVVLAIFLLLFTFIPEGKEDTIFNEPDNSNNSSNSIGIDSSETSIIVKHIVSSNQSNEVLNLTKKDEFVEDKLLEKSNDKFNELINSSE